MKVIDVKVVLTGEAERYLTELSAAYKEKDKTVNKEYLISRMIADCADGYEQMSEWEKLHQMVSIHYLLLAQANMAYFSIKSNRRAQMSEKVDTYVQSIQYFCDTEFELFYSKGAVVNALIHDMISKAKLSGEDLIKNHIYKHTHYDLDKK